MFNGLGADNRDALAKAIIRVLNAIASHYENKGGGINGGNQH
ncbi:hypothetical protein [Bacillus amyloliquefaciens]|nr:hypothetical protein [Bacillus amyloliquefaciens]